MAEPRWTVTMLEERFEEAARTLRRLPDTRVPGRFQHLASDCPQRVRGVRLRAPCMPRIAPSPQAIGHMEETITWLAWLDPDDARIVWLRAEGVRWKPICCRVGLTRQAAWARWVAVADHDRKSAQLQVHRWGARPVARKA